jgi:hypothetical protein
MGKLENGLPLREPTTAVLRSLLDMAVVVKKADKPMKDPQFWATLVGDDNHLSVLCAVDLPLSAYLACALSGVAKNVAEEFIKAKKLEAANAETLREVINVASSLFNVGDAPHVRLLGFAQQGSKEYTEWHGMAAQGRARSDLTVEIPRYGNGSLAFITFEKADP